MANGVSADMLVGSGISFATVCDDPVWFVSDSPAGLEGHEHRAPQVRVHLIHYNAL